MPSLRQDSHSGLKLVPIKHLAVDKTKLEHEYRKIRKRILNCFTVNNAGHLRYKYLYNTEFVTDDSLKICTKKHLKKVLQTSEVKGLSILTLFGIFKKLKSLVEKTTVSFKVVFTPLPRTQN